MCNIKNKKSVKIHVKPSFFWHPTLQHSVSHKDASRNSSKITRKMNLQPVSNIELIPTHMELELDMLDIPRKLVMYFIYEGRILKK
jgi:hypothetical protein